MELFLPYFERRPCSSSGVDSTIHKVFEEMTDRLRLMEQRLGEVIDGHCGGLEGRGDAIESHVEETEQKAEYIEPIFDEGPIFDEEPVFDEEASDSTACIVVDTTCVAALPTDIINATSHIDVDAAANCSTKCQVRAIDAGVPVVVYTIAKEFGGGTAYAVARVSPICTASSTSGKMTTHALAASGAFDRVDASNLVWQKMAASEGSLAKDLTIERLGEHKNRVLSATDRWQVVEAAASRSRASDRSDASVVREESGSRNADEIVAWNGSARLGQDMVIKEVVGRERRDGGSDQAVDSSKAGSGVDEEFPQAISAERKDGSDEAGLNNVSGSHSSGNLDSSSNEESSAHRSSEKARDAHPRDHQARGSSSYAVVHSTNSSAGQSSTPPDATIRIIKDQMRRAKTYLGFLASRGNHGFGRELRARMRDVQRALGDATSDRQLPQNVHSKIRAMEQTLVKVRKIHDNCSGTVNRLRTALQSTEQQLQAHKRMANYLAQVAAKSLPKGLHCLTLRLTNEYHSTNSNNKKFPYLEKLEDPKLYHYALFSDNVLAAAVVVNSTLQHAKKPENHVFHVVTDRLNYAAMRMWFLANPLGKAAIQVQNIEEFTWLNSSYSPVLKQLESRFMIDYYFRSGQARRDANPKFRNPKYLSILNHLRFYLPEIFPKLNKVLFLDDDTVVQRDLSALWLIDLKGKVNGAVETCRESFHRFDKYLNFSNPIIAKNFDPHACGWAYGMNIFDLSVWRKQNITEDYHTWQKLNENRLLWKLGTLPAGLVTFWNRTFPLDHSWHQLGLGYNPNLNEKDIRRASVIHYNGNLKPWLEIGVPKYRKYWSTHVNFEQVFLRECNINP